MESKILSLFFDKLQKRKAPVYSNSVQHCGQPTVVAVPVQQSYGKLQWLLVEVCDLAIDNSSCRGCSLSARIRSAKSEDALK